MFGRMGRVIGPLIALLIIGLVAAVAFSLGQASVPVGTAVGPSGAAVPVYVGHYGWGGFGFGFLGFLFPLFFIFLLIWALRPHGGGEHAQPSAGRASEVHYARAGAHQAKAREQFLDLERRARRQPAFARFAVETVVRFVLRHRR